MRVERSITVKATRQRVWDIIHDPAEYPRLVDWITTFEPEDPEREPGEGARYRMRVQAGSAEVGGLVEIVEYSPECDIVWTGVTGIEQRGRLRVREDDRGAELTMRFSWGAPGALLGTLSELVASPLVNRKVQATLESFKRAAEGTEEEEAPIGPPSLPGRLAHEAANVAILARSGLVAPMRPDRLAKLAIAGARWGASPAMGVIAGAIRHPDRTMLSDELGSLTYAEVDRRSNALARGLAAEGVGEGDRVGVMCRDHRGFIETVMAAAKLGADVLLMNTSFAGPQLTEVAEREEVAALVFDEEFSELVEEAIEGRSCIVAWHEGETGSYKSLSELIDSGDDEPCSPPDRAAKVTILTSGTTGTPKGATRGDTQLTLDPPAALLERIPLHEGNVVRIGAPMFHAWGYANLLIGMALGATFVLARRFDAEECLRDIEEHHCEVLVVVPVMMSRILDLPDEVREKYDTSSLRATCASGSALPGELATRWMDEFGDNLYNMYGSTEVSMATLATPEDMRAAPGTAGRPTRGTIVRLYDEDGAEVPQGETGRIFVGNSMLFAGYTGGGGKDVIDGLMSVGDVGRIDETGRLFVQGRDDEMIVSGGENVFPKEVEDVLVNHEGVAEVAAIGVEDERFGQRLKAFVVLEDGADVSEKKLQEHVKSNLARYKVPREIAFLDELPRNPTGKVLKRELEEMDGGDSSQSSDE